MTGLKKYLALLDVIDPRDTGRLIELWRAMQESGELSADERDLVTVRVFDLLQEGLARKVQDN